MLVLKRSDRLKNALHHILGLSKLNKIISNREIPAETYNDIMLPKSTLNVLKKRLLHSSIVLLKRFIPHDVFPILQLPYLALEECLKQLDVMELIQLSLCSQKTKDFVKMRCLKPKDFKIRFDDDPRITICLTDRPGVEWIIDFSESSVQWKDTNTCKVKRKTFLIGPRVEYCMHTFWEFSFEEGLIKWVEHLCYIFASPITEMVMDESTYEGDILSIVHWSSTLRLDNVCFDSNFITKGNFETVLESLKASKLVCLDAMPKAGVRYKTTNTFNTEWVILVKAQWVTIDNILDMSRCKIIMIEDLVTSEKDLNTFITLWIDGYFSNLEYADFECLLSGRILSKELILEGVEYTEVDSSVERSFEEERVVGFQGHTSIFGGTDFYNKEGVLATCDFQHLPDQSYDIFRLFVWKDK